MPPATRIGRFDQLGARLFEEILGMLDSDPYLDELEELMEPCPFDEEDSEESLQWQWYDDALDAVQKRLLLRVSKALKNWATGHGVDDQIVREVQKKWHERALAPRA